MLDLMYIIFRILLGGTIFIGGSLITLMAWIIVGGVLLHVAHELMMKLINKIFR